MIRKYKEEDKEFLIKIAYDIWAGEIECTKRVESLLYKFLIEYYLVKNDLTYVFDEKGIKAFALAAKYDFHTDATNNLINASKSFSEKEKKDIKDYIKYIESNSKKVKELMNEEDVYFGLLASIEKGCGSALIRNLKEESKKQDYKNIYFWTDETCDFEYYIRHGFNKIDEYYIDLFGKNIKTFIYKIEL